MVSSSKQPSQQTSDEYMKAIVYGNTAMKLKREKYVMGGNNHTHQWCFYVKPYHKQSLGVYVKKVEIKVQLFIKNLSIRYFISKVLYDILLSNLVTCALVTWVYYFHICYWIYKKTISWVTASIILKYNTL